MTQAERKSIVEPDRMGDDLGRIAVTFEPKVGQIIWARLHTAQLTAPV
jgi:hypothetical protein